MEVIVCIKQVPSVSLPRDAGLDRSRGGQLNPCDAYALEAGLRLAEWFGGRVTALTMGPAGAEQVLRTALAMGADRAVLLCDQAFAGADVLATGYALSQAVRALGTADWIVCGQHSTDGDTAQLPASLAAQLELPLFGWVKGITPEGENLSVSQELSQGTQIAQASAPCVLAVGPEIGVPRMPSLRRQLQAKGKPLVRLGPADLPDQDPKHYGQAGSATRVVSVQEIRRQARQQPLAISSASAAQRILALVKEAEAHE